jgi:hypothetical protein
MTIFAKALSLCNTWILLSIEIYEHHKGILWSKVRVSILSRLMFEVCNDISVRACKLL